MGQRGWLLLYPVCALLRIITCISWPGNTLSMSVRHNYESGVYGMTDRLSGADTVFRKAGRGGTDSC